jgi:hypothetical protein
MRIRLALWLTILLLSSLAFAQQCTTQVPVNAFDSRTRAFLYGLTPADFDAAVGHAQLRISSIEPVFRNRVLVLLDSRLNQDHALLTAMSALVSEAPPGMPVAFGILGSHAVFTRKFITDPDDLSSAVDRVVAKSNSAGEGITLSAGLTQALDVFGAHQPGDTILLVTSGVERESRKKMGRLRKEFRRRGTRLQLLMGLLPVESSRPGDFAQLISAWDQAENFSSQLIQLANVTGGALMGFMNSDWLHAASSGYMLSIVMPAKTRLHNWKLRIRDTGNDVPPADLFYPDHLVPCSAPMMASLPVKTRPRP